VFRSASRSPRSPDYLINGTSTAFEEFLQSRRLAIVL
jgi:hypothetical protein